MRVEVNIPGPIADPRIWVRHEQVLGLVLQSGSIEVGLRRSEMTRLAYDAGEVFLCHRHVEKWIRTEDLSFLSITVSDAALTTACHRPSGEVELHPANLVESQVASLVAAVNAERIAGFPSGQLFLDSVEQALATVLVNVNAIRRPSPPIFRGGLGPVHLRRITDLVHTKLECDLSLYEMAQSIGLSTTHFAHRFRTSTGESPHQFVLRHRVERAKEMLRACEDRVLDVSVACGFKTQQHFARVFRRLCGISPTEYRREFSREKIS